MALAEETNLPRLTRRVALNVQRTLLGEDPGTLPVMLEQESRLTINMATAREIGWYPTWDLLTEAKLINEEEEDIARDLDAGPGRPRGAARQPGSEGRRERAGGRQAGGQRGPSGPAAPALARGPGTHRRRGSGRGQLRPAGRAHPLRLPQLQPVALFGVGAGQRADPGPPAVLPRGNVRAGPPRRRARGHHRLPGRAARPDPRANPARKPAADRGQPAHRAAAAEPRRDRPLGGLPLGEPTSRPAAPVARGQPTARRGPLDSEPDPAPAGGGAVQGRTAGPGRPQPAHRPRSPRALRRQPVDLQALSRFHGARGTGRLARVARPGRGGGGPGTSAALGQALLLVAHRGPVRRLDQPAQSRRRGQRAGFGQFPARSSRTIPTGTSACS